MNKEKARKNRFHFGYFDAKGKPCYQLHDYRGNVAVVVAASGKVLAHNRYYPYGEAITRFTGSHAAAQSNATATAARYRFGAKEHETMHGLNAYDFGPRLLSASLPVWDCPDRQQERYHPLSPYTYCAANPIRYTDPSGEEVVASNEESKTAILNTLPQEAWQYVIFDEAGYINKDVLNESDVPSENLQALKEIVNSDMTVVVEVGDKSYYYDENGNYVEFPFQPLYEDEQESPREELYGFMPTTGEQGHGGKTVFPLQGHIYNSVNSSVFVFINKYFSTEGQAQMVSHEAYGHAYMYLQDPLHPEKARHQTAGKIHEKNRPLAARIIRSMLETHRNYKNNPQNR